MRHWLASVPDAQGGFRLAGLAPGAWQPHFPGEAVVPGGAADPAGVAGGQHSQPCFQPAGITGFAPLQETDHGGGSPNCDYRVLVPRFYEGWASVVPTNTPD